MQAEARAYRSTVHHYENVVADDDGPSYAGLGTKLGMFHKHKAGDLSKVGYINSLPLTIHSSVSTYSFRHQLKTFLLFGLLNARPTQRLRFGGSLADIVRCTNLPTYLLKQNHNIAYLFIKRLTVAGHFRRFGLVVTLRRNRLVLGWVTCPRAGTPSISVCNQPPRSTKPSISPG